TVDSIISPDPFTGHPLAKLYYQIGTRNYPAKARNDVRPASAAELTRAAGAIGRVAARLNGQPVPGDAGVPAEVTAVPIEAATLARGRPSVTRVAAPSGGGQLTELRISISERAPDKLRATWLSISFDGEETVRAPLVDFFGTGPSPNPYTS